MIDDSERRFVMVLAAAIGGSVVSLGLLPWKQMTNPERFIAFVGGMACGVFGAPWIARLMDVSMADLSEKCGVVFFGAVFGLILMPSLQIRLRKLLGLKTEEGA